MVDLVAIQVGDTNEEWGHTSQRDTAAALEACPPVQGETPGAGPLVELAKADLADRVSVDIDAIRVDSVAESEFRDTSLGVPDPAKSYAQVITPGFVIKLVVEGQLYEYHAAGDRIVAVPETEADQSTTGNISIEQVQVTAGERIVVHGRSSIPEEACLKTELWANGAQQTWWPVDYCVPVAKGEWRLVVPLATGSRPTELNPLADYLVRAVVEGRADVEAEFPFDLAGPPAEG
jgi:hypothetical protein